MPISRQTFVVQVREADGLTVVENVRTRECVRVGTLEELPPRIARWLDARRADKEVEQCSSSEEER
jgi:hypothetical protein